MRRETDGYILPNFFSRLPAKLQAGLIVLFWLGPSALIAAFFAAIWVGWLSSPITENQKILVRVETKLDTAVAAMHKEVIDSHDKDESIIKLLWATCRNGAKTTLEEQRCDSYWRR